MKGLIVNIEKDTLDNNNFRKVLYTGEHTQLVLMSLKPREEIGLEIHSDNDQFFRFESGEGKCLIDGNEYLLEDGVAVVIPRGAEHNIINTSETKELKFYTIYSPPHHKDGIIRKTKKEAVENEEDFDGVTSEQKPIRFCEREYYVFSNFSSFAIMWKGHFCLTLEHAYQMEKFQDESIRELVRKTTSAHDSKKVSHEYKDSYRKDWNEVKLGIMKEILREKVRQHPYVKKKLLDSGDRAIIEDSWWDEFWGWGKNKDGANHLGKLWMEVREEVRNNRL